MQSSQGNRVRVENVDRTERISTVYNFTIEEYHTFYVSETGAFDVWVHNNDPRCAKLAELEAQLAKHPPGHPDHAKLQKEFQELQKDIADRPWTSASKPGPKTDINAPHNAKIRSEANLLRDQDNVIISGGGGKERLIPTPGGLKAGRRPDIEYRTPNGEIKGRNVGKTKADGTPLDREIEALNDLSGPGGLPTDFVPYYR